MTETDILSLPELARIQLHKNETEGRYYLHFIEWTGITPGNNGYWTSREITEEEVKALLKLLYPEWDGHGRTRCIDVDPASECKRPECFKCKLECPMRNAQVGLISASIAQKFVDIVNKYEKTDLIDNKKE